MITVIRTGINQMFRTSAVKESAASKKLNQIFATPWQIFPVLSAKLGVIFSQGRNGMELIAVQLLLQDKSTVQPVISLYCILEMHLQS